jgi:ADP-ribose pyrophosphatase YjhB (NUDIX family)
MKFCPACAHPLEQRIPAGDTRVRSVCPACGAVHYENPRVVVGCVPEWQGRILLCRRAIAPRRGYWTTPAGFLEIGETLQQAAARESLEEAQIRVQIGSLLSVTHVLHAAQVHVSFRARMLDEGFGAGVETLEVGLYEEATIPWDQIAFPSISFALRCYLEDRRAAREQVHFSTVEHPLRERP